MIPFHRKWFGHRLNNSLNRLAGLWTFLRLKDENILLHIIVLIVRGCFDGTHGLNKSIFALDARALLMLNYDKLSRIISCLLLTRNHMIFLVQFRIYKHLLIFSRPHILVVFKKIYSCLFNPNCSRNHVITYTKWGKKQKNKAKFGK